MPSTTNEYIPGKLSLCIGMPIMLRANDATELCITKGQEAVVCGWHSSVGPSGQEVLETLFVRLCNPPKKIQIADLPENVVPLVRTVTHLTVLLEDDTLLSILREQVVCLLNFAMTDYTSQGKSRAQNPVELANCRNHMSYYVALSRGFTAEGTIIIQGFDKRKITSGMSGFLRQELRELELLDEITKLRYEGGLPRTVSGIYRRSLIRSYYTWKKDVSDPSHFHPSMRWTASMGPRVPDPIIYGEWRASGSKPSQKRKASGPVEADRLEGDPLHVDGRSSKRLRVAEPTQSMPHLIPGVRKPVGMIWDSHNYSCGYDATFTILANIWADNPEQWTAYFGHMSGSLGELAGLLLSVVDGSKTLEHARNVVRRGMHSRKPDLFPYGHNTTSIDRIAQHVFPSKFYAVGRQSCISCGFVDNKTYGMLESYLSAGLSTRIEYPEGVEMSTWMHNYMTQGKQHCPSCRMTGVRQRLAMSSEVRDVPGIMLFDLTHDKLLFSDDLTFEVRNQQINMKLRGIIYGGQNHFTCRYIQSDGSMWFHDGITTGSTCLRETKVQDVENRLQLHKCGEKTAVALIYARTVD
ncbi:hypothetical protein C8F04DRAFT_965550 [Mycena alexandri]|uniref:Uncharacterized protein n=1 Tax=Mycena alexandri TaxID=1745969 RepID=A0AAD6SGS0_9AGAR|nr:hypothetical protein C8F04DRAFT_965550 [Mycena alexandri]